MSRLNDFYSVDIRTQLQRQTHFFYFDGIVNILIEFLFGLEIVVKHYAILFWSHSSGRRKCFSDFLKKKTFDLGYHQQKISQRCHLSVEQCYNFTTK